MKKLFVLSALALVGLANAQTEKGSWVVSGSTNIGFNNSTNKVKFDGRSVDGPKTTSFNITPSVGYFVANNIAIGVDLSFTAAKTTNTQYIFDQEVSFDTKSNTIIVMPNATYYFKSASKVMPYLGAGIGYFSNTTKYPSDFSTNNEVKFTTDGLAWGAKGGIVFLVTPSVGIDLGLAYVNTSDKEDDVKNVTNTFGVNAGFSFFFK